MKKLHFLAALLFLVLFSNSNIWAKDTLNIDNNGEWHRYILMNFQVKDNPYNPARGTKVVVIKDLIRGELDTLAPWHFVSSVPNCSDRKFEPNTNYLALSEARMFREAKSYSFSIKCDGLYLDTPENREKLAKKYDNTVVVYKYKAPKEKSALLKKQNNNLIIWTSKYALLEIRVKEKRLNLADGFYVDSVLLGELDIDKKMGIFSKKCGELPKGNYLILAKVLERFSSLLFIGACPVLYTESNLKRLSERWKKCTTYGSIKERRPAPARGDFCGDEENIFNESEKSNDIDI